MAKNSEKSNVLNIGFIESHLEEGLLLAAEELFDKEPILTASQIKKGSWELIVEDQNIHYSASIEIKKEDLISHDCNCIKGRKKLMCQHIAVGIFYIRKKLLDDQIKSTNKKKKSRIDLLAVLNKIPKEDLQSFALQYTKKNKAFKLILQARFIDKMEEEDLVGFFESIYPIHTLSNQKVSASNLSIFVHVVDELKDHFKDLMLHQDYTQAYKLIHKTLSKAFYIKHHMINPHKGFDSAYDMLLNNYIECHRWIEAPEYRFHMLSQLSELLGSSFINAETPLEQSLWMEAFNNRKNHRSLEQNIQSFLSRQNTSAKAKYFISMLSILTKEPATWKEIIKEKDGQDAYRIILLLIEYKHLPQANEVMQAFILYRDLNHTLAKIILSHLPSNTDIAFSRRIVDYLIRLKDDLYLRWLQGQNTQWDLLQEEIAQKIEDSGDKKLLLRYHLFNNNPEQAGKILISEGSWDLIKNYDEILYDEDPEICFHVYATYLSNYLSDHFGSIAHDHMETLNIRARKLGRDAMARRLKSHIASTFPHRDWNS